MRQSTISRAPDSMDLERQQCTNGAPVSTARLRPLMSQVFEVAIAPDPVRVSGVRHDASTFLRRRAVPRSLTEDVALVVSELVTNAIKHGLGTVSLRMLNTDDGELRIEVRDASPAPARLRTARDQDVSGRGMYLVAAFARDWGVSADGTTTWATFRIPAGGS
ncbi:ATP-binding protein [Streptomyces sp. NPDC015125]|uniref:ATP-binding protein n=1 Tax=Streptomyces sp. NPDC015125 TaxID=3364938 RepID=UPI0036FA465D